MSAPQEGFLLIADITGYTGYLSSSELEHAQEVLQTLLELLIEHTKPPLVISRLAGDAVISYALSASAVQGQTFIEMLENTYISFRKAIERMVLNNTCQCRACANIPALDLKFFSHYGTFAVQRLSTQDELVGSDVNLIHRLLKNHVTERTGLKAYTLYTQSALDRLGIEGIGGSMTSLTEEYEHLGEVRVWVQDMAAVWERRRKAVQVTIPPGEVALHGEIEIALPPYRVWDYLVQPEYRKIIFGSDKQNILDRRDGRVTEGSIYQCFHGKRVVAQTILEWLPFELMVTEDRLSANATALVELRLASDGDGTRLGVNVGTRGASAPARLVMKGMMAAVKKSKRAALAAFKQRVEREAEAAGEGPGGPVFSTEAVRAAARSGLTEG